MSTPINPRRLLDHAQDLVDHRSGPGRPRAMLLRRAVSSAYYALFHDLAVRTGRQVLPHGTAEEQLSLCRSIDHGRLKEVCARAPDKAAATSSVAQTRSAIEALDRHAASPDLEALLALIALHSQLR